MCIAHCCTHCDLVIIKFVPAITFRFAAISAGCSRFKLSYEVCARQENSALFSLKSACVAIGVGSSPTSETTSAASRCVDVAAASINAALEVHAGQRRTRLRVSIFSMEPFCIQYDHVLCCGCTLSTESLAISGGEISRKNCGAARAGGRASFGRFHLYHVHYDVSACLNGNLKLPSNQVT
jgi:hypothetical protein